MADFDPLEAAANRISAHYKENARTVERANEREKKRIEGKGRRGEECGEGGTRIGQDKSELSRWHERLFSERETRAKIVGGKCTQRLCVSKYGDSHILFFQLQFY